MGGEPTFVSIDDMEGPEWNTAADSPQKRRLAGTLLRRLAHCYGHGALLHFGQGKWYPGESLPRWALGCYWRKDGEPIWRNPELISADAPDHRATTRPRPWPSSPAWRKGSRCRRDCVVPGYEDVWYYLWKERRLPINVDPLKSKLENEEERKRLARIFERGLGQVVGYALPVRPIFSDGLTTRWQSGRWFLREENMYLLPGDSPMGYRLPLDSLPWYATDESSPWSERDPLAPRGPLPSWTRGQRADRSRRMDFRVRRQRQKRSWRRRWRPVLRDAGVGQSSRPIPRIAARAAAAAAIKQLPGMAAAAEACEAAASTLSEAPTPFAETIIAEPTAADHPHRPMRGGPRGPHARFHAAGLSPGRLSEPGCGRRRHGRGVVHAGDDRGLPAAVGLPFAVFQGNARSRRDRGQPAAFVELEGTDRQHDDAL